MRCACRVAVKVSRNGAAIGLAEINLKFSVLIIVAVQFDQVEGVEEERECIIGGCPATRDYRDGQG